MGAASFGLRERTVRWLASAGSVASVFLLLTGSRAGLASAAAAVFWTAQAQLKPPPARPDPFSHSYRAFSRFAR